MQQKKICYLEGIPQTTDLRLQLTAKALRCLNLVPVQEVKNSQEQRIGDLKWAGIFFQGGFLLIGS